VRRHLSKGGDWAFVGRLNRVDSVDLKLAKFVPAPDADSETTSTPSITATSAKAQPLTEENLAPSVNGGTNPLATPQQQETNTPSAGMGKSGGKKKSKKR